MKKSITWAIAHTLHWAALYAAFYMKLEGAQNLLVFLVLLLACASPMLLMDAAIQKAAADAPRSAAISALNWFQAWATLCLFAWHGWFVCAVAQAVSMFFLAGHLAKASDARKAEPCKGVK